MSEALEVSKHRDNDLSSSKKGDEDAIPPLSYISIASSRPLGSRSWQCLFPETIFMVSICERWRALRGVWMRCAMARTKVFPRRAPIRLPRSQITCSRLTELTAPTNRFSAMVDVPYGPHRWAVALDVVFVAPFICWLQRTCSGSNSSRSSKLTSVLHPCSAVCSR